MIQEAVSPNQTVRGLTSPFYVLVNHNAFAFLKMSSLSLLQTALLWRCLWLLSGSENVKKNPEIHSDVSKLEKTSFPFSPYMCCVRRLGAGGGEYGFLFLSHNHPPKNPVCFLSFIWKEVQRLSDRLPLRRGSRRGHRGQTPFSQRTVVLYVALLCHVCRLCLVLTLTVVDNSGPNPLIPLHSFYQLQILETHITL